MLFTCWLLVWTGCTVRYLKHKAIYEYSAISQYFVLSSIHKDTVLPVIVWPLIRTHFKTRTILLHLFTLNDTHKHTQSTRKLKWHTHTHTHHTQYDTTGQVISPSQWPPLTTHNTHNRQTRNPHKLVVPDTHRLLQLDHQDRHNDSWWWNYL